MFNRRTPGPSLPTRFIGSSFFIFLAFLIPFALFAQQDQTAEWKVSIGDLEKRLPGLNADAKSGIDAFRGDAETLRSSVADFAAAHPEMSLSVPAALPESPSIDTLRQQLEQISAAVDEIVRRTPGSPFNLGRMEVTVTANLASISPVADSIDQTEIRNLNLTSAAKALDYLPGVSIQHIATNRNEAGIMVRGFSTRGQVPLYLDGIPISVPYDGYIDFNRFLTSDISEVQVARGYSSPLAGPNAVGGTINLVTQEPIKKLDVDALIGTGSAGTLLSALRLGTRWRRFFVQGSLDWLQSDYIPLSGNFPVLQYKNLFRKSL